MLLKTNLHFVLLLIFSLHLQLSAQNWNEIIKATASDAAENDTFGFSVAIDGDYAIVGAYRNDDAGDESGAAYIFERLGNNWVEQAKLTASDAAAGDNFGHSVDIDNNYVIVGAYGNDDVGNETGSAYIFMRTGINWTEQEKLTANDANAGDQFGYSVAIDGDHAIVGARHDDFGSETNSGSSYIFKRSGGDWSQQVKLTASDAAINDLFGLSVDIDGDYAIVGAYSNNDAGTDSGSAYIFRHLENSWTEQIKLTASDASSGDNFGFSVAIDGSYAVVGAPGNDDVGSNSGSSYVFVRSGISWVELAKLNSTDAASEDYFGRSVSLNGDYAIIGAYNNDDAGLDSGSAYIFRRSGNFWIEQIKLTASDADTADSFGFNVSIHGNSAIVGSFANDDNGSNSGSAYFFEYVTSITYTFNNGVWSPSDPSGVSTANDDIVIVTGDAIFENTTYCHSLIVQPGASLTLSSGVSLISYLPPTFQSTSTSYSSLIGNLIQTTSMDNNPIVNYERYVNSNSNGNDLISPPVSGVNWQSFLATATNADDLLDDGNNPLTYAFAPFNKTIGDFDNFTESTNTSILSGFGYRVATDVGTTLTFIGRANTFFTSIIVKKTGPIYRKWNLMGNPFTCHLNVQGFLNNGTNFDLLEAANAGIYGYNGNTSNQWTILNLANTTSTTGITPGQGFFVAVNSNGYLEFNSSMTQTGNYDDFIPGRNAELTYLKLNLSSNSESSRTDFYFNENASQGLDKGYDAAHWETEAPEFGIYSYLVQDNVGDPIALQTLNPSDLTEVTIPLGVNASQGEQITFSISESTLPASVNVYLDDVVANTTTLLNTSDYIITPTTNLSGTGRFFFRTSEDALSINDDNLNNFNIFTNNSNKELVVNGQLVEATTLELYDIQGRRIFVNVLDHTILENRIDVSNLSGGVYVVNVKNKKQQKSQKVIIK